MSKKDGIAIFFHPEDHLLSLQRFTCSALACQQYLLWVWKTKKTWSYIQRGRERTGRARPAGWLPGDAGQPLTASEHVVLLQKPARQQVSLAARMPATVLGIQGIASSLSVSQFHEYFSTPFVYKGKALCLQSWLLILAVEAIQCPGATVNLGMKNICLNCMQICMAKKAVRNSIPLSTYSCRF